MSSYESVDGKIIEIGKDRPIHGEGLVSSYGDLLGYYSLIKLFNKAGIEDDHIYGLLSDQWNPDAGATNLIYLGSPISNARTAAALHGTGYHFDDEVNTIIKEPPDREEWKADSNYDYCIVAKRVAPGTRQCHIVVAGLGPLGAHAGCYYLGSQYKMLSARYSDGAFANILRVGREAGYTDYDVVHPYSVS